MYTSYCIYETKKSNDPSIVKKSPKLMNYPFTLKSNLSISCMIFLMLFMDIDPIFSQKIELTVEDLTEMQATKADIKAQNPMATKVYADLIEKAEISMETVPFSVMNKKGIPPSGNKHDYMSMAPYWWPNPEASDGLPYIRKDGEINPEARNDFSDYTIKARFFNAVEILGKAYFYAGDEKYASKAISLMQVWFIDSATIMNPHLNFGQSIRGINDGRCFGVIEFGGLKDVITTLELVKSGGALDSDTEEGVKDWLKSYSQWLQTSELGSMEGTRSNNHGTTYDVQLCSILLYLGEVDQVKVRLDSITKRRIATQIEPDGRQLHELARTKAFTYSTMNLSAFTKLAWFGKRLGVDLWNYETTDGRGIKRGYEFLIPYLTTDKKWKYQQIKQKDTYRDRFARLLQYAGKEFDEPSYTKIAEEYFNKQKKDLESQSSH